MNCLSTLNHENNFLIHLSHRFHENQKKLSLDFIHGTSSLAHQVIE